MAGLIEIYNDGTAATNSIPRVRYYLSGGSLRILVQYFQYYMASSAILMRDEHFKRILEAAPFVDWLPLDQSTDETVAEVARLLSDVLDPTHPYWTKECLEHAETLDAFREECAKTGRDADAEIYKSLEGERKSYREIIALIHERLGTSPGVGEQTHAT
ncbi:MAG: hypothetical protein NTV80_22070 [Verrucomicrobia bacterium]|nr:hypothetical protein [Verrucomicrobiota bacterium]